MVTRVTAYLLGALLVAVLIGAAAVAWVAGTTEGARWLLAAVSRHTDLHISAGKVEGRLGDHLQLKGVRISLPRQTMQIEDIDIRWKPLLLLAGTIGVRELTLQGVRIQDNTPVSKKPPVLVWPRLPGSASLFDGRIERLRVDGISYRHLDEQPVTVNSIAASVAWQDMLLTVSDLSAVSPSGRAAGNIAAGFQRPSLKLDLGITPTHPIAQMESFSIQARMLPGKSPEQLAGRVKVAGSGKEGGKEQHLAIEGVLGMTGDAFNLRQFLLTKPGRRGTVTGEGTLSLATSEPLLTLQMKAADIDLAPELGSPTDLSGNLTFSGTPDRYKGHFDLANRGLKWQTARISGEYQGNGKGLKLAPVTGSLLGGSLQGDLEVGWREAVTLQGTILGRKLDPARITPDWGGVLNFDLTGGMAWSKQLPLQWEVSGNLLESSLHGQSLTGAVQADFAADTLRINRLALQGKGFDLHAAGRLDQRLTLAAHVSDLSLLVPGTAGELRIDGWTRWSEGRLGGAVTGHGSNLAADGIRIAAVNLSARLEEGKGYPLSVAADLRKVLYGRFQAEAVNLKVDGTLSSHTASATVRSDGAEARLALAGAYIRGSWQGAIMQFSGRDSVGPWKLAAPARLMITSGKISLASLTITGVQPERIAIAAELTRPLLGGSVRAEWSGLNLARVNHWLKDVQVTGSSSGNIRLALQPGERLTLAGSATAMGTVTADGHSMTVQRSLLDLDGGEHGLRAGIELHLADGAVLKGSLSSPTVRPVLPDEGNVSLEWQGIDLALLDPWLPGGAKLEGRLSGRATGRILPGLRFEMDGNAALSRGKVQLQGAEGEINLNLRAASVTWGWREETLSGTTALTLAEYGQARGSFHLPIPARFPIALDPRGPLQATLTGQVQEKGVLTALFPGVVQESHGELDADLKVSGTWEVPQIEGKLHLEKGGAYLPTAGIHIKDVQITAHLEKDQIRIDSFRAVSGPGHIEGAALLHLKGWHVSGYSGHITGDRFQTVYFPEHQLQSSPKLTFEGTPEKLQVRGEVQLPELRITGTQSHAVIAPSMDVIVEGRALPAEKSTRLALDIQVRVVLGDKVMVKVEGIDAQLGGSVDLSLRSLDRITSKGEIRVVKGRYRTYGVNLEIVRGRLFYAGGPIDNPTLDILALRTLGEVRAGVKVGGTLHAPVTKLYSEPAMPDVDILAYIVLGHPLGSSGEQASLVAQAAGFLLSTSQSEGLQNQIKNRLGLSTLEIQSDVGTNSQHMGYKPMTVTPPGTIPATQTPGVTQTMMTIGKYLTPQLYISYGRSLFTNSNLFLLRYDIFKHWQIETQTGTESGVDLYYKLEFN